MNRRPREGIRGGEGEAIGGLYPTKEKPLVEPFDDSVVRKVEISRLVHSWLAPECFGRTPSGTGFGQPLDHTSRQPRKPSGKGCPI